MFNGKLIGSRYQAKSQLILHLILFFVLKSVFIKSVQQAFINKEHIGQYWEVLHYLGAPDFNKAVSEYTAFEKIFHDFLKCIK